MRVNQNVSTLLYKTLVSEKQNLKLRSMKLKNKLVFKWFKVAAEVLLMCSNIAL